LSPSVVACAIHQPSYHRNRGWVRVIADLDGNGVTAVNRFDHAEAMGGRRDGDPVRIDPGRPRGFEIVWDAIPTIERRVVANDPTLADLLSADTRAPEALLAARA
jgi:hypothetical protein